MPEAIVSFAQNREDVVLWRALGDVPAGRYVEVGANHPVVHSITKTFSDHGWSGLLVEPVPQFAQLLREHRPRDVIVEAAVTEVEGPIELFSIPDTGLSTLREDFGGRHAEQGWHVDRIEVAGRRLDSLVAEHGFADVEVHLLVVDVEGAEEGVLRSVDLRSWRPWVLVIEATEPNRAAPTHETWEPIVLDAGYEFCLFDGVSRFYCAAEHADRLRAALSVPASAIDAFADARILELQERAAATERMADERLAEVMRWRAAALTTWAADVSGRPADRAALEAARSDAAWAHEEIANIQRTVSWRVTRPLRAVRRRTKRR